jgi:dipeptidyl aminopeptidase/acylaminoacyl peptidase
MTTRSALRLRGAVLYFALATLAPINLLWAQDNRFTVDDALAMTNVQVGDLSPDGRWLVVTSASLRDRIGNDNRHYGDPSYVAPGFQDLLVIDTRTGESRKIFADRRQVRSMSWSPDGSRLALLARRGEGFEPLIWERASGKVVTIALPKDRVVSDDAALQWSADGKQLFLAMRDAGWRKRAADGFERLTTNPIVVNSSTNPFLSWEELGRLSLEQSVGVFDTRTNQTRELVTGLKVRSYDAAPDASIVRFMEDITTKTDYDVIRGNDNQLKIQTVAGGEPKTLFASTRGLTFQWSRDGRRYAYAKDGAIYVGSIDDKEARKLFGPAPATEKVDSAARADQRFNTVRLSADGTRLIASNRQGLWLVDVASGNKEKFLDTPADSREAPRYTVVDWSPDGNSIYLSYSARSKWERGFVKYDVASKQLRDLVKDGKLYSGFRLSEDGSTVIYNAAEGNRPADVYVTDPDFRSARKLTDTHAQLRAKTLARTELFSYYDADGDKLWGVLYYPVGYEQGKRYPVVFNVYEEFFDDNFNATINVLTANGYAVVQPSVSLEIGYPGEAWIKGVTAAANKLIEMGVADADRLGVQGTSYGGYATNLLITQTDRFKAAINISGKVDMISFYTDSPRLGVRNIHAPEKSQDRLGATLWQAPQKYIEHSAIFFADRIKTPLLLLTGHEDPNVPERTTMEMFYALRRLGKEVEWVSYTYGGHGMPTFTEAEVRDYHARILGWYDKYLKAPGKKVAENNQ